MASNILVPSPFSAEVFEESGSVVLGQGDWMLNNPFKEQLLRSWKEQYADYLGKDQADKLVDQLVDSGDIFLHDALHTLVATEDEQQVGLTSLRPYSQFSLITMLEVITTHRGRGIGKQLVEALCSSSLPLVAHVSIHRPQVKEFYQRLGFSIVERAKVDHYGHYLTFDVAVRKNKRLPD